MNLWWTKCAWLGLWAALLMVPVAAVAQAKVGGQTLRGRVLDPSGAAVANAQVTVIAAGGVTRQATSDGQGRFEVAGVPTGSAEIVITASGFASYSAGVPVPNSGGAALAIHLKLGPNQQNITVNAESAQVNLEASDQAASVDLSGKALQSLADDPDQLATDLAALAGPAVGGDAATIYIDGFTQGDIPPKSAIASVQVNNDPFSAQFNRLGYGRVQIQTKPGSQDLHGNVEYDGNTSQINSLQPFLRASGATPPPYHSNIYSANVSGPLGKRATWYFGLERRDINNLSVVNAQILNANLAPQSFVTSLASPSHRTALTPRFDFQLTPNNILTARYERLGSDNVANGVGGFSLPSQAFNTGQVRHNLSIGDTEIMGPNAINRLRFQFLDFNQTSNATTTGPTIAVTGAFTSGGNANGNYLNREMHNDMLEDLSLTYGSHQAQLGGEVNDVQRTETNGADYNGTFVFSSLAAYQATEVGLQNGETMAQIRAAGGGPSQFTLAAGNATAHINRLDSSLYAQDAWQAGHNLTLNYGLRFETENIWHDHADWAPRLGFAWGLGHGAPTTVVRGGFGIFYRRFDDDQMIVVAHLNGFNQKQYIVSAPDFYPNVPDPASLAAGTAALPTTYLYSPLLEAPPTMTTSLSVERQLGKLGSLTLSYLHSYGWNQLYTSDINAPLPGSYDPALPNSGVRPFGLAAGNMYEYANGGVSRQDQLTLNFKLHAGASGSVNGYYTYNDAHGDTFGAGSFPTEPWNLMADYGPSPWNVRHRFYVSGTWNLPWGVTANPFVVAQSGRPYSLTLGEDLYGTGQQNARPALATASTPAADVLVTPYGRLDINPSATATLLAPNTEIGPAAFAVNLRLMKNIGLGGGKDGRTLGVGVEARNLLNTVNFGTPVGDVLSPLLGQSLGLMGGEYSQGAANRRVDLIATFSF